MPSHTPQRHGVTILTPGTTPAPTWIGKTMTTTDTTPAHCDAEQQLRRASYALQQMKGRGMYDIGELAKLLTPRDCPEHAPAGIEAGRLIPTASRPLSLDPHESYHRPPFTGRD